MEHFSCRTKIIMGMGSLQELSKLEADRIFLVADPYFIKNGTAGRIGELTQAKQVEIFDRITPDPTVELAAEGTALMEQFGPDLMVALGGGSTLDCAKAIRFFGKKEIRLVAVPTTSGSGSEVTDFAILTHDGAKHPLVDKSLQPDVAILDGELLGNLPPSLIADAGFDVLSHALEAIAATGGSVFTDALAQEAFRRVFANLYPSYRGDRSVRQTVHAGSAMAGLAFNQAGLGLCHSMSHALGGLFHVPHGRLNAILLPEIVAINGEKVAHKYGEIARFSGFSGTSDTMAVRWLQRELKALRKKLELPASLRQAGVSPRQVTENQEKLVAAVLADPCSATNPVKVEGSLVRQLLGRVTDHG